MNQKPVCLRAVTGALAITLLGGCTIVQGHGQKLKAAQLRTAFEKIDLAKLATWKLEGVK